MLSSISRFTYWEGLSRSLLFGFYEEWWCSTCTVGTRSSALTGMRMVFPAKVGVNTQQLCCRRRGGCWRYKLLPEIEVTLGKSQDSISTSKEYANNRYFQYIPVFVSQIKDYKQQNIDYLAPKIFNALADALELLVAREGVRCIFQYLDNFTVVGSPDSQPICSGYSDRSTTSTGSVRQELRLPEDKLQRLVSLVSEWENKRYAPGMHATEPAANEPQLYRI